MVLARARTAAPRSSKPGVSSGELVATVGVVGKELDSLGPVLGQGGHRSGGATLGAGEAGGDHDKDSCMGAAGERSSAQLSRTQTGAGGSVVATAAGTAGIGGAVCPAGKPEVETVLVWSSACAAISGAAHGGARGGGPGDLVEPPCPQFTFDAVLFFAGGEGAGGTDPLRVTRSRGLMHPIHPTGRIDIDQTAAMQRLYRGRGYLRRSRARQYLFECCRRYWDPGIDQAIPRRQTLFACSCEAVVSRELTSSSSLTQLAPTTARSILGVSEFRCKWPDSLTRAGWWERGSDDRDTACHGRWQATN
ncbi:putative protein OS=Tsukamurella paurometabola (strain ATCC 8368 / DSM / CCUG 35730 /CIP 100753 / JCM 10117 / KCTC 9821 / NBRC 16120 / NCIMB 702349/ NCTC 13040) OX=521096 GN=Tpau_0322 PE=4 SV=1 [Tsukamurella paurometabola]|uniref:Uncharacterized protein n=1 Tax=Tsukamurella paurometabola (strain ATCC 8368 / DSM 20162 / CCUG 35730 / CIP 100753 / JCM 10117 / KCTC 9821 / NBRC 16120 / NCIMB 702349 / NCTC 13040) TaxID=521096 RepID=D5URB3_TSUPD|nr:hypothetical protein Tpau_0322 [Tsukamurella paurometabola DSM 20162]SUP42336.1 Uncharacterised protein [Tsukamurella paurometabola]